MWNQPSKEKLNQLPKLYSTEEIPLKEKLIQLHLFIENTDFYIIEYDGKNTFWSFVILNGDMEMSEFGYVNYEEIQSIRVNGWQEIECDLYWKIRPANQVEKICVAKGWHLPEPVTIIEIECPVCKRMIIADLGSSEVQCHNCKVLVLQQHINSTSPGGLSHGLYS